MINDLPNYFGKLGIELPEVLCDGKYEKVKNAIEFNKKGWAVGKTDAKATIETYNASLLVKKSREAEVLFFRLSILPENFAMIKR